MSNLDNIFKIFKFTNDFRAVKRTVEIPSENRFENDVEHAFQVAMIAWYLIEANKLKLDKDLAIKYSLVHDLVEVYAGDVDPYLSDQKDIDDKEAKENEAFDKIKNLFPEFDSLAQLIADYQSKKDDESKFVCALDKILPVISVYLDKYDYYNKHGITLDRWIKRNKEKVCLSPEMKDVFDELVELLKKQDGMFAK